MNSARQSFEKFMVENAPAVVNARSFTRNEDGSYQNVVMRGHYAVWEAARANFQSALEELTHVKDLNRPVKFRAGCDCGCNTPSFTTPFGALRFLMHRLNSAGIADAVGESYAHDIMAILKEHNAVTSDDHLSVVLKA